MEAEKKGDLVYDEEGLCGEREEDVLVRKGSPSTERHEAQRPSKAPMLVLDSAGGGGEAKCLKGGFHRKAIPVFVVILASHLVSKLPLSSVPTSSSFSLAPIFID